jgi:hypothetical protein
MLAPVTHILPLTKVRRQRLLPVAGRVTARVGQKVNATDMIAEAKLENRHVLIDVREVLRLSRSQSVDLVMERTAGEELEAGDVIAQTGGLFRKVVRSPVAGKILSVTGGRVMLEVPGEPFRLLAGLPGEVVQLIPDRGVVIEANGGLLQGSWGNGRIDQGVLVNLVRTPDETFTRERLTVDLRGAIVLAGHTDQADVFKAAADLPVRGLVLGSMTADLVSVAAKASFPVMLLEGFGRIPINPAAYEILAQEEKPEVALNAVQWQPLVGTRPELFIPRAVNAEIPADLVSFQHGQMVRVSIGLYAGKTGQLVQLHPGKMRVPSGLLVTAADVRLTQDMQVTIPLANLEVLQ